MKPTDHFTLAEFTASDAAPAEQRQHPDRNHLKNLKATAVGMEAIRKM